MFLVKWVWGLIRTDVLCFFGRGGGGFGIFFSFVHMDDKTKSYVELCFFLKCC